MIPSVTIACIAFSATVTPIDEKEFYGQWKLEFGENKIEEIEFRADHSFNGDIVDQGIVAWKFAGTWKLGGDELNYVYTESSFAKVPVGTMDADTVIEVNRGGFLIRNARQQYHWFKRVK